MKYLLHFTFLILLIISPLRAAATEYFVATNGNDIGDGTNWATARLTIQAGLNLATNIVSF